MTLKQCCKRAAKIVKSWPAWKQALLGSTYGYKPKERTPYPFEPRFWELDLRDNKGGRDK